MPALPRTAALVRTPAEEGRATAWTDPAAAAEDVNGEIAILRGEMETFRSGMSSEMAKLARGMEEIKEMLSTRTPS